MAPQPSYPTRDQLEREHGIPPDRFCGLTADEMSRAIVAHDCAPHAPGQPIGYDPIATEEARIDRLREAFGPEADVAAIRQRLRFFLARVSEAVRVDWMLDDASFDRAVWDSLAAHYPDLSSDARNVIVGNYSYSHMR